MNPNPLVRCAVLLMACLLPAVAPGQTSMQETSKGQDREISRQDTQASRHSYRLVARVSDHAGVLAPAERADLESLLASYEAETTHQVAVLTVPHLGGQEIDVYALRTANAFGLGRKAIDNGMLVMVALRERKIRIELGKGFQSYIADEDAQRIIAELIAPELARGRFAAGLTRGLIELMSRGRLLVAPRS